MRVSYADPPYIGQARKHYAKHPDFAGEVDHAALIGRLNDEYPDGWALSLSCKSLQFVLSLCPPDVRVLAWTKPMVPLLPGVRVQYGWEPVIMRGGRQGRAITGTPMVRDWISESPEGFTFQPKPDGHVIGRKPRGFCFWLFECLGLRAGDEFVDLFPGSGAVAEAWREFAAQMPLGTRTRGPRLRRNLRREAARAPLTLLG